MYVAANEQLFWRYIIIIIIKGQYRVCVCEMITADTILLSSPVTICGEDRGMSADY